MHRSLYRSSRADVVSTDCGASRCRVRQILDCGEPTTVSSSALSLRDRATCTTTSRRWISARTPSGSICTVRPVASLFTALMRSRIHVLAWDATAEPDAHLLIRQDTPPFRHPPHAAGAVLGQGAVGPGVGEEAEQQGHLARVNDGGLVRPGDMVEVFSTSSTFLYESRQDGLAARPVRWSGTGKSYGS